MICLVYEPISSSLLELIIQLVVSIKGECPVLGYPSNLDAEQLDLDLKGLKCPITILQTKKVLREMNVGELVKVQATDPATVRDFKLLCKTGGHKLLSSSDLDGVFTYVIRKGE